MKKYINLLPSTVFIFGRRTKCISVLGIIVSLFSFSCTPDIKPLLSFSVSETSGIHRDIEFLKIEVPTDKSFNISEGLSIREKDQDLMVRGQVLDSIEQASDKIQYTCLFPVSIEANSTKTYDIVKGDGGVHEEQLTIKGTDSNITIENSYFIADLTDIKADPSNGLGAGQLAGLVLKQFNKQLLERSHINMHWAPNFQKEGLDYKTFGHIIDPDSLAVIKGPYSLSLFKSGSVEGYEGISVTCQYQFYAGLPYFIFSSEIKIKEDLELMLLRNDEMTMDSLFTHVMFSQPEGGVNILELYLEKDMTELENDPIRDDAPWLCFYNYELEYGFGSIRLEYDNTDVNGQPSTLYGEHTKITSSANNGRYWNRRLIHDHNTLIPQGNRYYEKNAYLVFHASEDDPSREILEYQKRLLNPLTIQYHAD
jgi:hypothetical protein